MTILLKMIQAFPRGRTAEELFILLGTDFSSNARLSALAELDQLSQKGLIRKGVDGRWKPVRQAMGLVAPPSSQDPVTNSGLKDGLLYAAPATFHEVVLKESVGATEGSDLTRQLSPSALLRYWRSALRADPRGAITQTPDRHGTSWHLATGAGPLVPGENCKLDIKLSLASLSDEFRKALERRHDQERTLAVGWPMAVGRKAGTPVLWPVGLVAAEWSRTENHLELSIDTDDVLANPDWLKGGARSLGWSEKDLHRIFMGEEGLGLGFDEFSGRLREVAAGGVFGVLSGRAFAAQLDPEKEGIYNVAGLFLPTDTTFTAGAVRDLDRIATWSAAVLAQTALAPILGLAQKHEQLRVNTVNTSVLNAEQIEAVRNACAAPLSVVTGPPGTGKSQAIVSMAASVIAAGGSVLVVSKNHQALDAVEDRLSQLAPELDFIVRTLDPAKDVDRSFAHVLTDLVNIPQTATRSPDSVLVSKLATLSTQRDRAIDLTSRANRLQCDIAEIVERISLREAHTDTVEPHIPSPPPRKTGQLKRLILRLLLNMRRSKPVSQERTTELNTLDLNGLRQRLQHLRIEASGLGDIANPVTLTENIANLATSIMPAAVSARTHISPEERLTLAKSKDHQELLQGLAEIPEELARQVVAKRPLWLASVLGAPKRIPLEAGLFDLVIFDEASQCDIAAALPLFARGRRAVVVGDNHQLSFISQIGVAHDRNLMRAQDLPIAMMGRYAQSRLSLFDFAIRVPDVPRVLLKKQYRSASEIVDYISGQFYGGKLQVACDHNSLRLPQGARAGITWTNVTPPLTAMIDNTNAAEVEAIVSHLYKQLVTDGYEGSVGVISPFRPQVNALTQAINKRIPKAVRDLAELRVGTVDSFQGQERDLILFSPCVSSSAAMSAVTFLQKDWRRLNVAISRARAVAHVFGDLAFARSNRIRTLTKLASFATEPRTRVSENVFDSEWERRVFHALKQRGLEAVPQYEIAGRRLDFALFGLGDIKLDLEVDGRKWHMDSDGNRKQSDIFRDHQLTSMGWRVRRFWVDELVRDMEGCLDLVERDLS